MPLKKYGVLMARAIERRREGGTDSPHYQISLADGVGTTYRAAVNVLSQESPSELLYFVDDDLKHPITGTLLGLTPGWHALGPRGGVDFIRGNLFSRADMRALPAEVVGPDNDLADMLDHYVERAIAEPDALVYVFGEPWGPESARDKVFGFRPGNGVHDIHMNQGNSARFRGDDGVWQDGGLLLHFPGEGRWVGIFLAFQSQAWHTDDTTGHAIAAPAPAPTPTPKPTPTPIPTPVPEDGAVRILAAMVNPNGGSPERETVLLLNVSPDPIDLAGWRLADRMSHSCAVPSVKLDGGAALTVTLRESVQLGNKGGSITLLDKSGLKVAGVAYTAEDAGREGWTVTF
jgi:uncharacterized protein YukJ